MGKEEIKKAYEMSLHSEKLDVMCLSSNYEQVIGSYFDKEYSPRLFSGKTKTREILPDNQENRQSAGAKDKTKNQVRFIEDFCPSESDLLIFDNIAILVSYNPESPLALVISESELVAQLKTQFDNLWTQAGR